MFFFIEELQGGAGEIYSIIPSFHPYLSTNMCAKLRNVFHIANTHEEKTSEKFVKLKKSSIFAALFEIRESFGV
jgi:hypothetical protein